MSKKQNERRQALGKGLGALIPTGPPADRPVDVFFPRQTETSKLAAEGDAQSVAESPKEPLSGPATTKTNTTEPADSSGQKLAQEEDVSRETSGYDSSSNLKEVPGAYLAEITLAEIIPNRSQPRQVFDDDELRELSDSITEVGVLQPIVVRPLLEDDTDSHPGAQYELIMGERRWRASRMAGLESMPAIVRTTSDEDLLRDALLENLHRAQLNPLEEAAAYQQLLEDFGCTQEELARRIARSRPQISNTLRLLRLPALVQRRVAAGVISAGHARALLSLEDPAAMERMAQRIVAEGLSVRATEELIALGDTEVQPHRRSPARPNPLSPQLTSIAEKLSDKFETRVKIGMGQKKGRVTIEFATIDDLSRILEQLDPESSISE